MDAIFVGLLILIVAVVTVWALLILAMLGRIRNDLEKIAFGVAQTNQYLRMQGKGGSE